MPLTPPDMTAIRRVLIVKLSSIGDVVQALPVSAALGDAYPHLEISWVVEEMSAPMVTGNPYLKEVIVLPPEWRKSRVTGRSLGVFRAVRRDLRARQFDVALDLQGLSKSALIAHASGARYRYGYDWLRELAPRLETRVPRRPESIHVVEQFLDVARFLGAPVAAGAVKFPLHIPQADREAARELLCGAGIAPGQPFIAVNPSVGGGGNKGWGAERFAAALDALAEAPGLPAVLVGSRADAGVAEALRGSFAKHARPPVSLVGRTSLKQLAAVLDACALHLSGDTGSAHIAAALGTPVVTIFGRSNPARLAPYGQGHLALHHRELCAAPCFRYHATAPLNSKQKCLAPPPVCLASVRVDEVVATVRRALAEAGVQCTPGAPAC